MTKQTDGMALQAIGAMVGLPTGGGMPAMPGFAFDTSSHATSSGWASGFGTMDGSNWTVSVGSPDAAPRLAPVRWKPDQFGMPQLGQASGGAGASVASVPVWVWLAVAGAVLLAGA